MQTTSAMADRTVSAVLKYTILMVLTAGHMRLENQVCEHRTASLVIRETLDGRRSATLRFGSQVRSALVTEHCLHRVTIVESLSPPGSVIHCEKTRLFQEVSPETESETIGIHSRFKNVKKVLSEAGTKMRSFLYIFFSRLV